jgi:pimeloyl-ACP methyl ester carboxylesterase
MSVKTLSLKSSNNENIKTWLYSEQNAINGLLVFCHGFTGNSSGLIATLSEILSDQYAVCRFDFRGQGESDGDFATTTIGNELEDLDLVIGAMQDRLNSKPLILVGHSFGATITLLYAQNHRIDGIALLSGEGDLQQAIGLEFSPEQLSSFKAKGSAQVINWSKDGESDTLNVAFLHDMETYSTSKAIATIDVPKLFVHGQNDDVIPVSRTKNLYDLAHDPKQLVILDSVDHSYDFFGNKNGIEPLVNILSDWLKQTASK